MTTRSNSRPGLTRALMPGLLALGLVMLSTTVRAQGTDSAATTGADATKFWEAGSSVQWNRRAIQLFRDFGGGPNRSNAYLSIAQYHAVLAARADRSGPPPRIARSGRSRGVRRRAQAVFVLEPGSHARKRDRRTAFRARAGQVNSRTISPRARPSAARSAARNRWRKPLPTVLVHWTRARHPSGRGYWVKSSGAPIVRGGYGARTFFLPYDGEVLSPPPPAFNSPAFVAARSEVRAISDTRTAEQIATTRKWVAISGGVSLQRCRHRPDRQASPVGPGRGPHPGVRTRSSVRRHCGLLLYEVLITGTCDRRRPIPPLRPPLDYRTTRRTHQHTPVSQARSR